MRIRAAVVSLVWAFLFISSVPAFAKTCSPRLIKQYFPQFPSIVFKAEAADYADNKAQEELEFKKN